MNIVIKKQYKHLLWQDELYKTNNSTKHTFILLNYAEVYKYSSKVLALYIWDKSKLKQIKKLNLVIEEIKLDEPFNLVFTKIENLKKLISLGHPKNRESIKRSWIKNKEKLLQHRILPFLG